MSDPSDAMPLADLGTVGRLLTYLAAVGLAGAWATAVWLVPRAARRDDDAKWNVLPGSAWRIGRTAAWLLLLATLLRAGAQLQLLRDPEEPLTGVWLVAVLTGTVWGRGWMLQMVTALVALVAWRQRSVPAAGARSLALFSVIAVAVADAHTGHGMAGAWAGIVGVSLHAVHLLGVGAWLGTLAVAMLVLRPYPPAERRRLVAPILSAFAPAALGGGAVVVAAGVLMGVEYAGGWAVLQAFNDIYVRTLALKTVLVLLILALGAWHWRAAVPALASRPATVRRLDGTVLIELVLASAVLLVTAILVSLPAQGV